MSTSQSAKVQCYSGHAYAQEPRAFSHGGEQHTITKINKRWREPAGPCFEVLTDDGATYLLAFEEAADRWHVSARDRQP
jgi:hypothetical protein